MLETPTAVLAHRLPTRVDSQWPWVITDLSGTWQLLSGSRRNTEPCQKLAVSGTTLKAKHTNHGKASLLSKYKRTGTFQPSMERWHGFLPGLARQALRTSLYQAHKILPSSVRFSLYGLHNELHIYKGNPLVSTTIQTKYWKPTGRDLYIVLQKSGKGLALSAMKLPSLALVNTTYRKICATDYGSLTHAACAKPKGATLLGKTGILSFPFRRKCIMKDCVRSGWYRG